MAHKQEELEFQEYLKQIEDGQPVETFLADLPATAQETRAALETVEWLQRRQALLAPRPGFVAASRKRLLAQLQTPAARQPGGWRSRWLAHTWTRSPGLAQSPYVMACLLVIMIGLLFQSGSLLARSAHTWLPGDFFYPVKELGERVSLVTSVSAASRASWHIEFAQQRLLEAQSLVFEGRYEQLPATAADFSYHVDEALRLINQVALQDLDTGRALAGSLHVTLSRQNQLIALLAQVGPESAGQDLRQVLSTAQNGMLAAQRIFGSDSGDSAVILTWWAPRRTGGIFQGA